MIGLVIISHSHRLAHGVAELASQMAPQVSIIPCGGNGAGGLGTNYDDVVAAIARASADEGAAVLFDLGSAKMVAEMAAEEYAEENRVLVVEAPLVEGAVAAAIAAQRGDNINQVAQAAETALSQQPEPVSPQADQAARKKPDPTALTEEIELTNPMGLHARPAALLARTVSDLNTNIIIRFRGKEADAKSVLALMGLGASGGQRVEVVATGRDAQSALQRIKDLAARGFDD